MICTAQLKKKAYTKEVGQFLMTYRDTPDCTTKMAPEDQMFKRKFHYKIPELNDKIDSIALDAKIQFNDRLNK